MPAKPRVYRAEGIVLRRRNLGESDTVFTVYSRGEGKFEAVARGVRKARSRMRGHLEPMTWSRFLVAQGRSLDVFTQVETVRAYGGIRDDLERSAAAFYCLELVDRVTEPHVRQDELFHALVALLDALEDGAPVTVVRCFELHLLFALGYEVQLGACALCQASLPEEDAFLAPAAGGLVCGGCRAGAEGGRLLPVQAVKALRFAARVAPVEFGRLRLTPELADDLRQALASVFRYHLDLEPRSSRFVDQVAGLPARSDPTPEAPSL